MALSYTDINTTPENLGDNNLLYIKAYETTDGGGVLIQTYIEKPFNVKIPRGTKPESFKNEQINPILSEQSFFAPGVLVADLTALKVSGTIPWTTMLTETLPKSQRRITRAVEVAGKGTIIQVFTETEYKENKKTKKVFAPETVYWTAGVGVSGTDLIGGIVGGFAVPSPEATYQTASTYDIDLPNRAFGNNVYYKLQDGSSHLFTGGWTWDITKSGILGLDTGSEASTETYYIYLVTYDSGTGDSVTVPDGANQQSLTDSAGRFESFEVGKKITISGMSNADNNGTFTISSYVSPTLIKYINTNSGAGAETSSFSWQIDFDELVPIASTTDPDSGGPLGYSNWYFVVSVLNRGGNIRGTHVLGRDCFYFDPFTPAGILGGGFYTGNYIDPAVEQSLANGVPESADVAYLGMWIVRDNSGTNYHAILEVHTQGHLDTRTIPNLSGDHWARISGNALFEWDNKETAIGVPDSPKTVGVRVYTDDPGSVDHLDGCEIVVKGWREKYRVA